MLQKSIMDGRELDPNCAICSQPAQVQCDCEAKGLDLAVRQAEQRIMTSLYSDIRQWVRGQAQDYILTYFSTLSARRREAHNLHIHAVQTHYSHYYTRAPHSEIIASEQLLKRGIDADWAASVQRYPEVLEYFYSLVDLSVPDDSETCIRDPPLSALSGAARGKRIARIAEGERARGKEREREGERDGGRERRGRRRATFAVPPYGGYGTGSPGVY